MKWYALDIQTLTPEEYEAGYRALSPEQRSRVDGFRFAADRRRRVAAELLARRAVARWCDLEENAVTIARGEKGKPYAPGLPVEFSLSHREDLVVCVVDDLPVGIDVELLRPRDLQVAKKICTPEELRYLFGKDPAPEDFAYTEDPQLLMRFYRLWTGKEACAKRAGEGLSSLHKCHPLEEENLFYENTGKYLIAICKTGK